MQTEKPLVAATRVYARWFERYGWLFLLLATLPAFLIDEPGTVINAYRALVMLPLLVYGVCRPAVLFKSSQSIGAQLFLAFSLYSLLTMAWSADAVATVDRCWGVLSTYALFTLVFLNLSQQPPHLQGLEKAFLIGGTVCLALSYYAADFHVEISNLNTGYGVFNLHVYVSWLAGSLCLLLLSRQARLSFIDAVVFCGYFATIIFTHSRGGLIAFTTGYLCMMFRQHHPLREKQVAVCMVMTLCLIYLYNPFHIKKMIDKGMSMRPEIWQHGYENVKREPRTLWLGAGLNASDSFQIKKLSIPHYNSLYLGRIFHGGLIGLALYLALLLAVIRQGFWMASSEPWPYLVVGMSAALTVYGDQFFKPPSPLFICFLLPFFITLFGFLIPKETMPHA